MIYLVFIEIPQYENIETLGPDQQNVSNEGHGHTAMRY